MSSTVPLRREAPGAPAGADARARLLWADNLKTLLIAGIIVIHAFLGYAGTFEGWTYSGVREVTLSPASEAPLFVIVGPFGLFVIGLLFLVAGLFTTPSIDHKGPRAFARDRLLRLGVTYVVYVLLVQPAVSYAVEHPFGDATRSYWYEMLGSERQLDSGPLWFVGVLLVFSLGYAACTALVGPKRAGIRVGAGGLWTLVAIVAATSFGVRQLWPYGGESGFFDLNYWQWPACLALFLIGTSVARRGWAEAVPAGLARHSRSATLPALVAMGLLLYLAGSRDEVDLFLGGWHWQALAFALVEAPLVVFGAVWMLAVAQQRLDRPLRGGPALSRSAFTAFILQTPVLVGLAVALRGVPAAAEVKALLVAGAGLVVCFGLAHVLVSRIPALRRVL